ALQQLDRQAETARALARTAAVLLEAHDSGDAELGQAMGMLQRADTDITAVGQRRDALRRRIDEYRTAAQLLSQARELLDEKLLPLGEAVAPQRAVLEQWSSRITGQLAAER